MKETYIPKGLRVRKDFLSTVESMRASPTRDTGTTLIQVLLWVFYRYASAEFPRKHLHLHLPQDSPNRRPSRRVSRMWMRRQGSRHFYIITRNPQSLPLVTPHQSIQYIQDQCLTSSPYLSIQNGYQAQRAMLRPWRRHDQIHQAQRKGGLY